MSDTAVLFRPHRGSLAEAMAEASPVEDRSALVDMVRTSLAHFGVEVAPDDVVVAPYGQDERIGWDTHIVTVRDYGVFGFTNGPL